MIEIKVDAGEVQPALQRLSGKIKNMAPVMQELAVAMEKQALENFRAESGPLGQWPAVKKPHKDAIGILRVTQMLMDNTASAFDSFTAMVTNNRRYAALQQLGGKAGRGRRSVIPPRPFLPVKPDGTLQDGMEEKLLGIVNDYLAQAVDG